MYQMKKYPQNQFAVSAVIGVIIMVAITVTMGAVAYAYFTGMIGEQNRATPAVSFTPSSTDKTITVTTADIDIFWKDINITITNATTYTYYTKTGIVKAGDTINLQTDPNPILRGTVTVIFRFIPTNSGLGSYTLENV